MVYHEIREVNGKKQNYLVSNRRDKGKWKKTSKFIGSGNLSKQQISKFVNDFLKC